MVKHAYLSASSSGRWLKCPPSAKLCAEESDRASPYAEQGTDAHALCEYLVESALGRPCEDPTQNLRWHDAEMQEAAEGYRDFVMEQTEKTLRRSINMCRATAGLFTLGRAGLWHRRLCYRR